MHVRSTSNLQAALVAATRHPVIPGFHSQVYPSRLVNDDEDPGYWTTWH